MNSLERGNQIPLSPWANCSAHSRGECVPSSSSYTWIFHHHTAITKNSTKPPEQRSNYLDIYNSAPNVVMPVLQCSHCRKSCKVGIPWVPWKVLLLLLPFSWISRLTCSISSHADWNSCAKISRSCKREANSWKCMCWMQFTFLFLAHSVCSAGTASLLKSSKMNWFNKSQLDLQ